MHMYMKWIHTYIWNRIKIKFKVNLKKPWHVLMQKEPVKIPFSSLYVGNQLLGMQPTLKFIFPQWGDWKKKTKFSFARAYLLRIASVRNGGMCLLLFRALGSNLVHTYAGPVHDASASVCVSL